MQPAECPSGTHRLGRTANLVRPLLLLLLVAGPMAGRSQDTATVYQRLARAAEKHRFTRWVHGSLFVAPQRNEESPAPGTPQRRSNPLLPFTGRPVRTVTVKVLDPFGFDLANSASLQMAWAQRTANAIHRTTREYLVREFVLVKHGRPFDALAAAESERLLRASPMVNDARLFVQPAAEHGDSVDVVVLVLDKWSLEAWVDFTGGAARATVLDRNLLGLGQELQARPTFGTDLALERLDARHAVYNIRGTYITSLIDYARDERNERLSLRLDRPFYSPLTRWAGAAAIARARTEDPVTDGPRQADGHELVVARETDLWAGRSFPLTRERTTAARSSALVSGIRYQRTRYPERPAIDTSGVQRHPHGASLLLATGLSVRQYYRDRYLYRFGAVEDVPEGLLVKLTGGFRQRENERRLAYTGIELSRGRHYRRFGYAAVSLGLGAYWDRGVATDDTYRADLRYFTGLLRVGRWYLRQFAALSATSITRKLPTERLNLNGDQLYGFRSALVSGTHRELLRLETVAYAPWHVLGFRFAPVLLAGFGTIGESYDPLFSGRIHNALGLGILVRNENLLVKTFEVSLSFYPYVPEEDGWVLDAGRYTDFTPRLADFAFTQPAVVGY
ncbi:MAG: hypothetical protein QY325_16155 [Flavobacteriales bacterium]|nr:MAG: hypothetical protein QY325_16155 [Flavobacteriales bacterium]